MRLADRAVCRQNAIDEGFRARRSLDFVGEDQRHAARRQRKDLRIEEIGLNGFRKREFVFHRL